MADKVKTGERRPNEIDVYVGSRLRQRRRLLNISQEKLADALGLTFQQVQKYERGFNRMSASKLFEAASFLQSPIDYFFEGLDRPEASSDGERNVHPASPPFMYGFLADQDGSELASAFMRISHRRRRKMLVEVAREFAADQEAAATGG